MMTSLFKCISLCYKAAELLDMHNDFIIDTCSIYSFANYSYAYSCVATILLTFTAARAYKLSGISR